MSAVRVVMKVLDIAGESVSQASTALVLRRRRSHATPTSLVVHTMLDDSKLITAPQCYAQDNVKHCYCAIVIDDLFLLVQRNGLMAVGSVEVVCSG